MANLQNEAINFASKSQYGQVQQIAYYCQNVKAQKLARLAGNPVLDIRQTQINDRIRSAQNNARYYLEGIQPQIIVDITNITAYFSLNKLFVAKIAAEFSKAAADDVLSRSGNNIAVHIESLRIFQQRLIQYKMVAERMVEQLQTLQESLINEICMFTEIVCELTITSLYTSQNLLPDHLGVKSMPKELSQVSHSLEDIAQANIEQILLQLSEMSSSFQHLVTQARSAIDASNAMEEVWYYLAADLGGLICNLSKAIKNGENRMRLPFLNAAQMDVQDVLQDINAISEQLSGLNTPMLKIDLTGSEIKPTFLSGLPLLDQ